ncbi:hypothetical protein EYV94_20835 [Puteibacter caeruleilacunae]|nr:hypothetical protein EYV94_20835 [Puteibacter caeruleilacunae]
MEYFIFNDSSIPFKSEEDANVNFPIFLRLIENGLEKGLKAVRVCDEDSSRWFNTQLTEGKYIFDWVNEQDNDRRILIKSLFQRTDYPYIPESEFYLNNRHQLSEFYLKDDSDCMVPSLGATYLLDQISVSYLSDERWDKHEIEIVGKELTDAGDRVYEVAVGNCANLEHWKVWKKQIETDRLESLREGNELWQNREQEFPNLVFVGRTDKQLKDLSISKGMFTQLVDVLKGLNGYCESGGNYSVDDLKGALGFSLSDESESVKQDPRLRRHRLFDVNGKKCFFGLHAKGFNSAFRLYFLPVSSENKIYIGYFGPHLPTKRNR